MKPASTMSHSRNASIVLPYSQPEYARLLGREAAEKEGSVPMR